MTSLDDILDQHLVPVRKEEIKTVLSEFGFEAILVGCYNRLIGFKSSCSGLKIIESPGFTTTIISTHYDITKFLELIKDADKKASVMNALSEITIILFFELIHELDIELTEASQGINKIVQSLKNINQNEFEDFSKNLNLIMLIKFLQDLTVEKDSNLNLSKKKSSIIWLVNHRSKEELVFQIMKKRQWARKHARLFRLFENPPINLKIIWNSDYYEELAYLIYALHKNELIGCNGNRGCFSAVEKHLFDFNDNKIKEGTLKTLSFRINKNWNKYEHRMSAVIAIIQAVQKKAYNY